MQFVVQAYTYNAEVGAHSYNNTFNVTQQIENVIRHTKA